MNLFDRPGDFDVVLPTLLSRARTGKRWLVVNYPYTWSRALRRRARELTGGLKMGKNYWPSAWRVYAKYLG